MKKILISVLIILLFLPTYVLEAKETFMDHFIPRFTPNNKEYDVIDEITFDEDDVFSNTVKWVYNDDWSNDTRALAYGYENNQYFIQGTGANYSLLWKGYLTFNERIDESDGFIIYFDSRDIKTSANNVKVGFNFYMSRINDPGFFASGIYDGTNAASQTIAYYNLVNNCYRFNENNNSWEEVTVNNNYLNLPKNDASYIYIPLSSLGRFGDINNLLSNENSFYFLSGLKISTKNLGDIDSQGRLYIDDLTLIKEKNSICEHDYHQSVVEANRLHSGYTINTCTKCGHVQIISRESIDLSEPVDDYYTYTFHYGLNQELSTSIKVKNGETCLNVPWMEEIISNNDKYTFMGWSNNSKHLDPLNPKTTVANSNKDFYAFYVLSSFEYSMSYPKYTAMASVLSFSGGIYNTLKNKCIFMGNSNNSLYHNLEELMSLEVPTINNSLNGGYTYSYLQFYEELIVAFKPKIAVICLTSNDFAYFNMSVNDIMELTAKLCDNIHDALPDTLICILHANVLPGRVAQTRAIEKLNNRAKKYCDKYDYLEFIDEYDVAKGILDKYDLNDNTYWETWTHMQQSSYDKWYSLIKKDLLEIKRKHNVVFD